MDRRDFLKKAVAVSFLAIAPSVQAQEKRDLSLLEELVNGYGFPVDDALLQGYSPKENYKAKYEKMAQEVANLEMIKYEREHALGNNTWETADFRLYGLDEKNQKFRQVSVALLDLRYVDSHGSIWADTFISYDQGCEVYKIDYKIAAGKGRSMPVRGTSERINQAFYAAVFLTKVPFAEFTKKDAEWRAKPWLVPQVAPKKERYPNPIDPKTGELIYYGEDWCTPCKAVSRFLVDQKIKFRERESFDAYHDHTPGHSGGSPFMFDHGRQILGSLDIIAKVKELYGIQ